MLEFLHRLWRTKGHGIHSPFAFRLVTTVINCPYSYYAYPTLDRAAKHTGESKDWIRLLHRLVCEFAPTAVATDVPLSTAERKAIKAADSRIIFSDAAAPLVIRDTLPSQLPESGVVIARSGGIPPTVTRTYGMLFTDGRIVIAVMRHDLPPQDFNIRILPPLK